MSEDNISRKIRRSIIKVALGAAALFTLPFTFYTVNQTEQAVVTQLGKPVRVVLNQLHEEENKELKEQYDKRGISVAEGAGLRLKIPFLQSVKKFDRRLQRWDGHPEEVITKDKKSIWVDTTARWQIGDPLVYLESIKTDENAFARLDTEIDSAVRNAVTARNLIEVVRTDNREMQIAEPELKATLNVEEVKEGRHKITAEITEVTRKACKQYGIKIHEDGILIKGIKYVESVQRHVEGRMIVERLRIADKYRSEGNGEYNRITGEKEREVKRLLSTAYRQAREIEGTADALAIRIYAHGFGNNPELEERVRKILSASGGESEQINIIAGGYNQDPDFYRFWQTLQLYTNALQGDQTRLIIGTDNPLFEFLKGESTQQSQH